VQRLSEFWNHRVLILGDVNAGKTRLSAAWLTRLVEAGHGPSTAVLDLAPPLRGRVGGPLPPPQGAGVLYRAAVVVPPRLTAADEAGAERLAQANAAAIEALFADYLRAPRPILLVNDATLYLQAGDLARFLAVLAPSPTCLVNAYYGRSFPEYALSRRERRLTDELAAACDRVVRL
jgi:GTPase SAR1 family protein